jgi:CheY-like chemotaxis protein
MAAGKPRILVVEDDGGVRGLLADRLTQYELVFVTCQSDCYAQLASPDFDLVLLDLRLPRTADEMKPSNQVGVDILIEIRKRRLVKRGGAMLMPVVVMTAHGSETIQGSVLVEHGANDYLPKPFGLGQELEHKITRALEGTAALIPAANVTSTKTVQLSFEPKQKLVRVETITYERAN